jgi:homoserine O-acetyltransferase
MSAPATFNTQAQFARIATPEQPFAFDSGALMDDLTLAYETYGALNPRKSNAILLFHALSGTQHAAGYCESVPGTGNRWTEDCKHGWWDLFIGPGKALDTNKFFIICANYLGGCYGSSGPTSINPATGKPYGPNFPQVSSADVVRSQVRLLDQLGITKLHAVLGNSIGGLLTLNLATMFPERVHLVISCASGLRTTVLSRLTVFEQVLAIENDPHFQGGNYDENKAPELGLALARMISHKTFVHLDAIERRARGEVVQRNNALGWYQLSHNVESYMLHQGRKFVKRFDANTYLRICNLWLRYDPLRAAGVESVDALFDISAAAGHKWLVFSIDSDFCFYPEEQAELVRALEDSQVPVMHITTHSDKGHDSFLLEPELYTPHLAYTLMQADASLPPMEDREEVTEFGM